VALGPQRLAERFHQLRTGRCRTGQYMKWAKNAGTAECGWCRYKTQTRNHLFKDRRQWSSQQKTLWAEVQRAAGKGKNRFKIRDLLADERCTQDSLRTTGVGSRVGPRAVSLKPDEEPTEEGDGGAAENGSKDQEEDEELEGKRGANAREE